MRILDYLKATGEVESRFAMRAGVLPETLKMIARTQRRPRLDIAMMIHDASVKKPGPNGEIVELRDMLREGAD